MSKPIPPIPEAGEPAGARCDDEAVPLNVAARYLRVPAMWLREQVESGQLPGLQAGRVWLVHEPTVRRLLADKAAKGAAR